MHPMTKLLDWLPELDFAVLSHGLAKHGRDYIWIIQDCIGSAPGTYEVTFTHCVKFDYETRVRDDVWPDSWTDEFTDYQNWQKAGEPDGYVWGTNWSNAYPGIVVVHDSTTAKHWSKRLGKDMFEGTLETDRFHLRLVFHSVITRKLSDDVSTISKVHIPLGPKGS
jgi:hypothetical protein